VTVPELVVVLAVLAMAGTATLQAARRQVDRAAVRRAREELAALVIRARSEAMVQGGAVLTVDAAQRSGRVVAGDSLVTELRFGEDHAVAVELGGTAQRATLVFDELGLGRVASRTVVFRRGEERAALVVSAYGRVVRR
jgi:hypothetical protein